MGVKKKTTVASQPQKKTSKPVSAPQNFPIVGIGASAGGLAAFEAFFSGMPAAVEPNMAFVLVQHLAPDHKSILTELVRRYTRMQVNEAVDGMVVQMNCAYIIPPNHDMVFINGKLQLFEPSAPRGQRLPIDFFFRSLAADQHERAIGIVLSGTGSDGTLGVRDIKGHGGMIMAQTPESAEYDGMPRNAIATGLVDYQLPPGKMAGELMAYVAHGFDKKLVSNDALTPNLENALQKVFALLRLQTSHDFSQYKPNTIHRRIERRMAVHQIDTLENYALLLKNKPEEVDALFRDLLIGVTSFFRDPGAFAVLEEQVIPQILKGKPPGSTIRVWAVGCSTGEEAYSIAILLQERMELLKQSFKVTIFGTDIDQVAIETARAGLYPSSVATDISTERIARYFIPEGDGSMYRVHKSIRDMLVFSEQDVIKDPPFSKLDLISCRNLLIYLGSELQRKLISLFHYALSPGGFLFLGSSEAVNDSYDLFKEVNRSFKLYQRQEDFRGQHRLPFSHLVTSQAKPHAQAPNRRRTKEHESDTVSLRALTEQALLEQFGAAALLVNGRGDILYLHGRTGRYLEPTPGEVGIINALKMARQGLQFKLTTALRQAAVSKDRVHCARLRVKTNGHDSTVNLTIRPLLSSPRHPLDTPLFVVIFEEVEDITPGAPGEGGTTTRTLVADAAQDDATHIADLVLQLREKEDYLHAGNEELETANEELKSSNEEMQSINEELQSANEELETSKEELQSVNEELATVNAELQNKCVDLTQTNNDLNNLLAGTGIATIFVDLKLRIMRFTPTATAIINLIPTDKGRPVDHIVSNLVGYDKMVDDLLSVLETLTPKTVDVQTRTGRWFTMRILPYRTLNNVIEGGVLTFVDITESQKVRQALRKANELAHLGTLLMHSRDALTVQDLQGRTLAWNQSASDLYGWSEVEALTMNVADRIPSTVREDALARIHQLSLGNVLEYYHTQRLTKSGDVLNVWMTSTALVNEAGALYAIATLERLKKDSNDKGGE